MTSVMMKIPGVQLVQVPVTKNPPGEIILPPQDNALRVIQLEQNLKFLQEQQQFMLAGLHREIEVLRQRNRDLQFQLVFSKGSHVTGAVTSPVSENTMVKRSVNEERLEKEAAVAKGAARSAEARALQLQQLLEAQTEKLKCLQLQQQQEAVGGGVVVAGGTRGAGREGALAARLEEAERLVRRLRAEGELQRREVQLGPPTAGATGVTNLLFDHSTAHRLYLQAIKNSLTLGMRASTVDNGGFGSRRYRPQNYQFPPLHSGHDNWYSGQRDDYQESSRHNNGRNRRSTPPMTLPDLKNSHHQSTVFASSNSHLHNPGYHKHKRETNVKSPESASPDDENPAGRSKASIPSDSKTTDEQSADTQRANHRPRGRRYYQQR